MHRDLDHLHADRPAIRESFTTADRNTVVFATRFAAAIGALISLVLVGGCASGKQSDTHARATDLQGQCCENLAGPSRDSCLREIVRVDDREAAQTSTNQATYSCVAEHFVCNPETGRPTPQSAQAQYDCMEDLQ